METSTFAGAFTSLDDLAEHGIARKSHTPVLWRCGLAHEWFKPPADIMQDKVSCPYCSGKKILSGFNDLQTLYPSIALEWHSKNVESVDTIAPQSNRVFSWVCADGHEWEATAAARTRKGARGCKICSGRVVVAGKNDLRTTHPDVAQEWHPTKNGSLTSTQVKSNGKDKIWWLGECGHEWEASLHNRTRNKTGCPYCSGHKVLVGFNDLATTHSHVAKLWHPTKNLPVKVIEVSKASIFLAYWRSDECGHEWVAKVTQQTITPTCRICSGAQVLAGFNDFATQFPEIAKQWHNKNILKSYEVSPGSNKIIWWKCVNGHEWEAPVYSRTAGAGCPGCAGQLLLPGVNDLSTTHPALYKQIHPTLNRDIDFSKLRSGNTSTSIWWQCYKKTEHVWQARVSDRVGPGGRKGTGCPHCANGNISLQENELARWLQDSLGLTIKRRDRIIISPYELDIYIPDKQIAIEYNGVYWHTESQGKNKNYHYNKWLACDQKGIQLIQIWSDDWNRNQKLIKNMLMSKLGVSDQRKISGRTTKIVSLTSSDAEQFLNENHIQGYVRGSIKVGLVEKDTENLVAVMVLKNESGTNGKVLNLLRFATSETVQGGFTKLLKHVEVMYEPDSVITFSDNTVSDGGLYKNHGFNAVKELPPDYSYVVRNERVHKFNYRLKSFKEDPLLTFEEGLTEKQLAELNGIERAWDSGKTKWVKSLKCSDD